MPWFVISYNSKHPEEIGFIEDVSTPDCASIFSDEESANKCVERMQEKELKFIKRFSDQTPNVYKAIEL